MSNDGGWVGDVIANEWYEDGEPHSPQRRKVNVIGASLEDDVANRRMVLRIGSTADWKGSVRVATTGDLAAVRTGNTLTASANGSINTAGIDGIADLELEQLVLTKNELAAADNGIYKLTDLGSASTPWVMERADLASKSAEVTTGLTTYVEEGTINARTVWRLRTAGPIVLNVTALAFESAPVTPHADVSAGPYAANIAQRVILCDSTGGAFTVTLPPAADWAGAFFWVKDAGGAAGANNISIEHDGGTIEGGASLAININRNAKALYSDGGSDLRLMSNA
jgi:hypothetical protein